MYIIDIPYEYSKDGEEYVASQLYEMVEMIQDIMSVKLDETKLKKSFIMRIFQENIS